MTTQKIRRNCFSPFMVAAFLCLAVTACGTRFARAQGATSTIRVETSQQLFATMCALDAAGFDANSSTLDIYPADAALRARLLQLHGPAVHAVRQFYAQHQFVSADETLSPFLSFALIAASENFWSFSWSTARTK